MGEGAPTSTRSQLQLKRTFPPDQIAPGHRHRGVTVEASSEGLGWSSAFASVQREVAGFVRIEARSYHLIVSSRSGPGDVTYRIGGQEILRHVQARGLFFLPAGHACDVTLHDPVETIHVQLDPKLFRDPACDTRDLGPGLAPILGGDDGLLQGMLRVMEELVRGDRTERSALIADLIAPAIASRLVAINHETSRPGTSLSSARRLSGGHLRKVRDFVAANLGTDIELQVLADLCGVSAAHFIRLFKSTTGVSPHQYILGSRVGRAKVLLGDHALTLADVAQSCGFANQQHLARTFRRLTGVTPGFYRRG